MSKGRRCWISLTLGWKIKNIDENVVEEFCNEI